MHIALGVQSAKFPIDEFLDAGGKNTVIVTTAPQAGNHSRSTLTFGNTPTRRGGEWLIRDQYSHRHPALSPNAGFPTTYDTNDPPYVLIFRIGKEFHVRFAQLGTLSQLPATSLPTGILERQKGIQPVANVFLKAIGVPLQTILDALKEQAVESTVESFDPQDIADGRKRILASILRRQGQQAFRRKVLAAYDSQCAITQCKMKWILEAAHITPYRGTKTNAISNGILLRCDLHTLFDLALISIEPTRMRIRVSSLVTDPQYARLEGTSPALPRKKSARPSSAAIEEHYRSFSP